MMDPTVRRLIEQVVDTPTKLHLLLIFHENPRLEATLERMAEWSCRDIWSVTQALHELVEDGILTTNVTVGRVAPTYSYTPRPEHIEPINRLVRGYDDPIERDLIQRAIRDLAGYASFRRASSWDYQVALT